jgi:hypothetical protein
MAPPLGTPALAASRCALAASIIVGCGQIQLGQSAGAAQQADAADTATPASAVIPDNKDSDIKLYYADRRVIKGAEALGKMQTEASLILWIAGNQFFAMDDVIRAFQETSREIAVGLVTLPPGLILKAIQANGWIYETRRRSWASMISSATTRRRPWSMAYIR